MLGLRRRDMRLVSLTAYMNGRALLVVFARPWNVRLQGGNSCEGRAVVAGRDQNKPLSGEAVNGMSCRNPP